MIKRTITQDVEKDSKEIVLKDIYIRKLHLFGICVHTHEFSYNAKLVDNKQKPGFRNVPTDTN